jgi:hypothetical protein
MSNGMLNYRECDPWSTKEDRLIKQHYPYGIRVAAAYLPDRSLAAIKNRAYLLQVKVVATLKPFIKANATDSEIIAAEPDPHLLARARLLELQSLFRQIRDELALAERQWAFMCRARSEVKHHQRKVS